MKKNDIDQSMGDSTASDIVLVSADGTKLGEVKRQPQAEHRDGDHTRANNRNDVTARDDARRNSANQSKKRRQNAKKKAKNKSRDNIKRVPERDRSAQQQYEPVNEHVRKPVKRRLTPKERRRNRRKTIIAVITEVVLGLAILIIGGLVFAFYMCNIEEVEVEGTTIYSSEEIQEYVLTGRYSNNGVYEWWYNLIMPKKDIPFVNKAKVRMTGLNSVKIIVDERTPFGYALDEGDMAKYFDEDGLISDISDKKLENVTIWSGVIATGIDVGEPVVDDSESLAIYLETAKALKANSVSVDSISMDENHNISAVKGNVKINFGLKNDIDAKCKRLAVILPQVGEQEGTLHLENFSAENTDIVFKKEN